MTVPKPSIIAFELTGKCRFNCKHCRADACGDIPDELTTDQCKKILDGLADFSKCVVIMTGGEPMERGDIYELISYTRKLGLRPVMATCGYKINEHSLKQLKEAGLMAISYSLDGKDAPSHDDFRNTPGAFDTIIEAAKLTAKAGIRFQINTTICKSNFQHIEQIAEISKQLGAYCFNPFILVPTGRGQIMTDQLLDKDHYENLLERLLKMKLESSIEVRVTCGPQFSRIAQQSGKTDKPVKGCLGGKEFGFISRKGDIQICGFLDISAGNLVDNDNDFGKLWTQSKFLNDIRNLPAFKGNCGKCRYLATCTGCRARAYALTGDYQQTDPICGYDLKGKNK